MNKILCGVCGEEIPPDQVKYFQGNPLCPEHSNRIEFYRENEIVKKVTSLQGGCEESMDEEPMVKIPIKLGISVLLASAGFDSVSRAYRTDYEGEYPIPDSVEVREIGHSYGVDFSIEVPQKLMDMLTKDCFLEIKVEGELDHITDDATEEIREIAYRSLD